MPEVFFACVERVNVEDSMEVSQVFSLDAIEKLILSEVDGDDAEPSMTDKE